MTYIRTMVDGRGKRFEALLGTAVEICGDVFSSASTRLAKENSSIAAKIGARVLPDKEGLFFRAFDGELEYLAVELPKVFEASLIGVFKPLTKKENERVNERLEEYFRIFGERYLQTRDTRLSNRGKSSAVLSTSERGRSNDLVANAKAAARHNMHRAIVARLDRYRYELRIFWVSVVTGFIVGTAGSLVAQVIWMACTQGR